MSRVSAVDALAALAVDMTIANRNVRVVVVWPNDLVEVSTPVPDADIGINGYLAAVVGQPWLTFVTAEWTAVFADPQDRLSDLVNVVATGILAEAGRSGPTLRGKVVFVGPSEPESGGLPGHVPPRLVFRALAPVDHGHCAQ
jgi:hypothetical protein